MNNQDSLRKQIIDSMKEWEHKSFGCVGSVYAHNNSIMFDEAIMPVLDAAMKAGELLVHRATTPQKPVSDAIIEWLEGCLRVVANIRSLEATASKRELLNVLYQLEGYAHRALTEARATRNQQGIEGSLPPGNPIPVKG